MDHLEALGLADERQAGALDAATDRALQAHLDGCEDCRRVLAAWPGHRAAPDLWPGLRARIVPAPIWAPNWLAPVAASLALALVLSAFWRPERAWLRADQAWAYSEPSQGGRP